MHRIEEWRSSVSVKRQHSTRVREWLRMHLAVEIEIGNECSQPRDRTTKHLNVEHADIFAVSNLIFSTRT